ncbi:hypothetical protein GE061_014097 [Apolygus lucorum]|uniref:Kazal-like domain-containing protein n=1 Tax=Apolygus lucorum TaxID=248454 RepID=A0A8S9XQT6_APOLU|nr:hypothetical protein GE061_014097 [Apolygus lucorum]
MTCSASWCLDLKYVKGDCNEIESCTQSSSCRCIEDRKVCLLKSDECSQHQCLQSGPCQGIPDDPVCDEEGTTHRNLCRMNEAGKRLSYMGRCLYNCKDTAVCGVDGNTYLSECRANARFISVDYEGPCQGFGIINNETGEVEGCPKDLVCPPLATTTSCAAFIPPGACCPVCAGAIRILYSQKQIMRYQKALNTRGSAEFTAEKVMKSLARHIEVAECALYGHLTMEMDLLVLIKSTLAEPTELQLQICALEAEKLAVLIQRGSPRIVTDLSTSILVYAKVVHYELQAPDPGQGASLLALRTVIIAAFVLSHLAQ